VKKAIFIGVALTLLALACNEPPVAVEEDYRLLPTSPAQVLKNVEIAFNQRDINLLKGMLSESFVFYFDPDDIGHEVPGGGYVIPESWTYKQFIRAVGNLFEKAYAISMKIDHDEVGEPGGGAATFGAEEITVQLLVMIDEVNGYIGEGYSDFEFEKYRPKSGPACWHLTTWWDNSAYGCDENTCVVPASFGMVLALFYQQ